MFEPSLVSLVPHCSSVPREGWTSEDDQRPLSELGLQQAAVLGRVLRADAVYSSPALRCRQSVEPVALASGVPVVAMEGLWETQGFVEPAAWVSGVFAPVGMAIGGAWAAGRAAGVLMRHQGGHIVLCSHGDTIPALLAFLAAAYDLPLPELVPRGGWFQLHFQEGALSITSHTP
jgi:8-oxo-dGTP diphosphatase